MTRQLNIEPISEIAKLESTSVLVSNLIEDSYHLKLSFLRSKNWVVVPVESGAHFTPEDAKLLSRALQTINYVECLAVATEPLQNTDIYYRISTSKEGLLDFSRKFGFLNFVLVSEEISFAVLCTVEDYYLVAGQANFVESAVGKSIDVARRDFFECANDTSWPDDVRKNLLAVYKRYEAFDGKKSVEGLCDAPK